ncbi:hypothetical protein SESBI_40470 [Sesbania bispinosa]|nr:hypothetical protein SESBI_40470 [Sesbania bispinosa]
MRPIQMVDKLRQCFISSSGGHRRTEEQQGTTSNGWGGVVAGNDTMKQIGTGRRKGVTEAGETAVDGVASDG